MIFITCSGNDHYFNNLSHEYVYRNNPNFKIKPWDRKCDCGKRTLAKKEVDKFIKQFERKNRRF